MAERSQTEAIFGKTLNPDGTLRAVSPSQIITFKRCGLRWHFDKKGRLAKKAMGKGAAIGDKAHKNIEVFLKTGQDVRGALELVGSKMLEPYLWAAPFNGGPGVVEGALLNPRLTTPGGVLITGYFDFYIPEHGTRDGGTEWPIIVDHKFKKDLIKWGYYINTPLADEDRWTADTEKLKDDPQTIIYGGWALVREPEVTGVVVRHHQHQTEGEGGRFSLPAEVRLTRDDLLRRWGALAEVVDGPMCDSAKVPAAAPGETPDGVPYNTMACGDFGGCDFARTCKHSPSNRFATLLGGGSRAISEVSTPLGATLSLLTQATKPTPPPQTAEQTTALLKASVALTNDSVGHPGVPFMTDLKLSELKAGVLYLIPGGSTAKFEALIGTRGIFRAKDGGLREVVDGTVKTVDEETLCLFEGREFKKPAPPAPIETKAPPAAEALSAEKEEKKRKLLIVDIGGANPITPPDVAKSPSPAVPEASTQGAQSNANAAAGAPATEVKVTTAEAVEPKKTKASKKAVEPVEQPASEMLMLLVNCDSQKATSLAPYVKGLCDALAQKHGTPDIRLGHKQSDLAFGGWKALLAIEAAKNPPKGLCSIQPSELADPVIEALIPLATVVVYPRGIR